LNARLRARLAIAAQRGAHEDLMRTSARWHLAAALFLVVVIPGGGALVERFAPAAPPRLVRLELPPLPEARGYASTRSELRNAWRLIPPPCRPAEPTCID
jgi:hypothetical protein